MTTSFTRTKSLLPDPRQGQAVLPALVPDMTYEGMGVSDGAEAGLAWEKMLRAEAGGEERKKLRSDLLAYCKQDTLAMVQLLEVLGRA